jgi:hypothetical protein
MKAVSSFVLLLLLAAPHLEQMLNDYGVTRDAIRACVRRRAKQSR